MAQEVYILGVILDGALSVTYIYQHLGSVCGFLGIFLFFIRQRIVA